MKRWTIAAIAVASVMFVVACRPDIYNLTSPPAFEWHIALRKLYSVIAFALVGYLSRRALEENGRTRVVAACILGMATYSALIEVAQFVGGAKEGLAWNTFDVVCGALGGAVAVYDRLFPGRRVRR